MTVLMHSWYYEKKDLKRSPSILDGLDIERENRYRREGARFIINVGTKMGLYPFCILSFNMLLSLNAK